MVNVPNLFHEILINREPETVFDYASNPGHWHEWLPFVLPGETSPRSPELGQNIVVLTGYRLLIRHGPTLVKSARFVVSRWDRPYLWEIEGGSNVLKTVTSYSLSRERQGTLFKRHYSYTAEGWFRYVEPLLARRLLTRQAREALQRLKNNLEAAAAPSEA